MRQLIQNLKTGKMEIQDVPIPAMSKGTVLVRNHYSVISAGTEGSKVQTARKGYLGKAKEKPEQVKQVLDTLKKEGISSTYKKVMNKLDALSPLGYSTAGEVIEVGEGISKFRVGDKVACAGANIANHAEVVAVPENLAVKIPDNVLLKDAAYTTIASIAVQGVRRADLRLGESCAIIGLGLIGQITVQLLKASGIKVFGIDIDPYVIEIAKVSGADLSLIRSNDCIEQLINQASNGYGVDAVIITAGTSSLDPIELAGRLCRNKGKVIIVGNVPTGFGREVYYKKELELRMATSYGPGRYNLNYEEKGMDYPIAYVRWTENRNMQAFLDLVGQKKIILDGLTTHIFDFSEAHKAYQMIVDKSKPYVGILLKYNNKRPINTDVILSKHMPSNTLSDLNISFIGAGSFAQNSLLPNIKDARFISVATSHGPTSKNIAKKWNFLRATTNSASVISEIESNTIFIATHHNSHATYVLGGLKAGKNIFVEKPLCMTNEELTELKNQYSIINNDRVNAHLMVGYNRRFANSIQEIKNKMNPNSPVSINYRINAGAVPADYWIQDKEIGGGRIIGEVCHFLDLVMFLSGSKPKTLYAIRVPDAHNLMDTLNISIQFQNGSIANISYFANGSKMLKKEYLELYCSGVTFVLDDFKTLYTYGKTVKKSTRWNQDKGHNKEIEIFLSSIQKGLETPIPFDELYTSSLMSFDVIESIVQGKVINY